MSLSTPSISPLSAARVVLRPRKALPFYGRHPWVLESAVERVEPTSIAGEHLLEIDGGVVDLMNDRGKFIARGFYNSQSRIRVRLLTWNAEEALDEAFFRRKIAAAIELRQRVGYESAARNAIEGIPYNSCAARLIFSEADGLSGLVVDRYGEYLVIQPTSLAMAQRLVMIVVILIELLLPR